MFPVIEPESELIQIQGQILSGNLMKNAGDCSLEQRPKILNPISMNIPGLHIGFAMVYRIMDKLRGIESQVRPELISMDFGPRRGIIADEIPQGAGLHILNRFHKDFA